MAYNPNVPAPTNRVQDDIAAMRDNFQHLAPLAQAVDELQTVSELAPYVQAILDSRIVEMGSNSNGEYVRWENGMQVCMAQVSVDFTTDGFRNYPYPAAFVGAPLGGAFAAGPGAFGTNEPAAFAASMLRLGSARWEFRVNLTYDNTNRSVCLFAIGRWK